MRAEDDTMGSPYIDRMIHASMKVRGLDRLALRALQRATELLVVAVGVRLAALRDQGDALQKLAATEWAQGAELALSRIAPKR